MTKFRIYFYKRSNLNLNKDKTQVTRKKILNTQPRSLHQFRIFTVA